MRPLTVSVTMMCTTSLVLAGCGTDTPDDAGGAQGSSDVSVVATTTMLGDVVGQVVECAGGSTQTLMPPGTDPHDFSASSEQVADMVSADLVVANGLGLEEGLADTLEGASADGATVMEVAALLDPIEYSGGGHAHHHGEGEEHDHDGEEHAEEEGDSHDHHDHGSMDPHVWHDVSRMAEGAELIGDELAEVTGEDGYASCGTEVRDHLMDVDQQVRDTLADVPAGQRVLITDHDAFGYFAQAYDFEVAATVIPGGSTLAEPSSQELSELVEAVRDEGVPAIFSNNATPADLVQAVAEKSGIDIEVVELFVGSVGPEGSGADTYEGMVTTNAERIAAALG